MRETKKGDARRSGGDERVREGKRGDRGAGKTVCVCDARHRRTQRREIEGMWKEEEEGERNDKERGS